MPKFQYHQRDLVTTNNSQYHIVRQIRKTGFSELYEAQQTGTGEKVALKIELGETSEDVGLRKEFQVYDRIKGKKGFIKMIDFQETAQQRLAAFEFICAPTLAEAIEFNRDSLDWRLGIEIVRQVLEISKELREAGIYNRDVKASNMFLLEDDKVLIFDFGIAHIQGEPQRRKGKVFASMNEAAPERFLQNEYDEQRSEIYSIATVGLAIHMGNEVWKIKGEEPQNAIIRKHTQGIVIPPSIPKHLKQVYLRATNPDPQLRQGTFEEFEAELEWAVRKYEQRQKLIAITGGIGIMVGCAAAGSAAAYFLS